MHLAIYGARSDVGAVVHAHPPTATAFAVAGEPMPAQVLPELACQVGPVATVPYFTPGTPAAATAFAPYLADHDAFLMANHGAATVGPSLEAAHLRMESLEHAARILLAARLLGRVTPLTDAQFAALPTRPRRGRRVAHDEHDAPAGRDTGAVTDARVAGNRVATVPSEDIPRMTRPPLDGGEVG
jgi:ribulose-5-phosphate 4-epimerase/fuculose-1-phosphate aldolase